GLRRVNEVGTTLGRRPAVALRQSFGLVYATRHEVVHWSLETGESTVLVHEGLTIGDDRIRGIVGDIGFLDDGTVTARVKARHTRCICIIPGSIVPCDGGGRPSAGTPIEVERTTALFRSNGDDIVAVLRPGDALPGVGAIATITDFRVDRTTVTFLAALRDGR